jgi:MATE family multidrug resistance protein
VNGYPYFIIRWAFEIVALAAGIVGHKELAAQTIVLNTCSLFYMMPLGLSIATSTRFRHILP